MLQIFRVSNASHALAFFILVCASQLITGCASYQQSRAILAAPPEDLPRSALLIDTPFVAQEDYNCGPSALSMMLQTQGLDPDLDELVSMVYVPKRQGAFQIELKAAARRFDLVPYQLAPKIEHVFREIDAGNPVLILQNLALQSAPVWHYAVVIGYDLDNKEVILHSGLEPTTHIAIGTFERTWLNGTDWALVMLHPEHTPVTATPLKYQKVIEEFVQLGKTSTALYAYHGAIERWPDQAGLLFGAGNLLYQLNEFEEATTMFIDALKLDKNNPNFWNNLAYSLAQLGCRNAPAVAQCALKLDSARPSFQTTPSDINALLRSRTEVAGSCDMLPSCPEGSKQ